MVKCQILADWGKLVQKIRGRLKKIAHGRFGLGNTINSYNAKSKEKANA